MMKQLTFSIGLFLFSLSVYSQNAKQYFQKGESEFYSKKYQEAIVDLDKLLEFEPNNSAAHFYKGMCQSSLGDNAGAIAEFTAVFEQNPTNTDALLNRGKCKQKIGDKEGACTDWKKAIELGDFEAKFELRKYCD